MNSFKITDDGDPFHVQRYGSEIMKVKSSVAMLKPVKVMMNVRNTWKVTMEEKSGYVALHIINGTIVL